MLPKRGGGFVRPKGVRTVGRLRTTFSTVKVELLTFYIKQINQRMKDPLIVKSIFVIKIRMKTIHKDGEKVIFKFLVRIVIKNTVLSELNGFIKTHPNNTISSFYPKYGIFSNHIVYEIIYF